MFGSKNSIPSSSNELLKTLELGTVMFSRVQVPFPSKNAICTESANLL